MPVGDESLKPAAAASAKSSAKAKPPAPGAPAGVEQARSLYHRFVKAVEDDGRYPVDAFRFLQEGLEYTVRQAHGQRALSTKPAAGAPDPRHVGGAQLCMGLRELALQRWGRMAKAVLNSWGLHTTRDFGVMVFLLVDHEFLHKTDQDHLEDFEDVFSFTELEQLYATSRAPLAPSEFDYAGESSPNLTGGGT